MVVVAGAWQGVEVGQLGRSKNLNKNMISLFKRIKEKKDIVPLAERALSIPSRCNVVIIDAK
jgi:hypothetical protein